MNFGEAIKLVKEGKKVCREGWNGKGMYIFTFSFSGLTFKANEDFPNDEVFDMTECFNATYIDEFKLEDFVLLKTAGNTCIPWNASQSDMMADDWELREYEKKYADDGHQLVCRECNGGDVEITRKSRWGEEKHKEDSFSLDHSYWVTDSFKNEYWYRCKNCKETHVYSSTKTHYCN